MENKNFVYKGWRTSGFLMLAVDLLLLAGSVAGIVFGAMRLDASTPRCRAAGGCSRPGLSACWCRCC